MLLPGAESWGASGPTGVGGGGSGVTSPCGGSGGSVGADGSWGSNGWGGSVGGDWSGGHGDGGWHWLQVDVGLSGHLSVEVGLGWNLLVDVGLSGDLRKTIRVKIICGVTLMVLCEEYFWVVFFLNFR